MVTLETLQSVTANCYARHKLAWLARLANAPPSLSCYISDLRGSFMTNSEIVSPCIKVCAVDGRSGWCLGCGRSLEEIATWVRIGEAGRTDVMADLPRRMEMLRASGALGETK